MLKNLLSSKAYEEQGLAVKASNFSNISMRSDEAIPYTISSKGCSLG